ncbi:MAG TPA: hypothetical protein VHC45_04345 [Gaiellaceae bacterium]|jgi:hypothetical protein|nr:hypothetical protein [Gaiellaceae bacterium]
MRRVLIAAAGALVLLGVAGSAVASRAPTASESKAIRTIFTGFLHQPSSPAAKDDRIVSIRVSSADGRYAAVKVSSKTAGPAEVIFHRGAFGWFVVGFGSSPGCDTAPKRVLTDLHVGCSPPYATAWINDCGPLVSRPQTLVITCADANYELASLAWHGWGGARATATGVVKANDCTPNCAAGHFHEYTVTATADELRACGAARYYGRLTIAYPGARPQGIANRDVRTLGC